MNKNFKTLEFAIELHQLLLKYHLQGFHKDQIQRSSLSVALNLSEGAARFTVNEKRRFYRIAFGSLKETQTLMKAANITDKKVVDLANLTGASIWKLLVALDKNRNRSPANQTC